jgi:uncharacterized glyoxalase superfamily protein PhnB
MATRKSRPASKAKSRPARGKGKPAPRRAAKARAPKAKASKAKASKAAARAAAAKARKEQRRQDPENLRLRTIEPSFTVDDLQASIRFYTEALGFFKGQEWKDESGVLRGITLKAGACELGLSQDDWKKGRDRQKGIGMRLWCTTVQDVDALARRIQAAGGTLTDGPTTEPWGGRSLSVVDPDGFQITIYREVEPAL